MRALGTIAGVAAAVLLGACGSSGTKTVTTVQTVTNGTASTPGSTPTVSGGSTPTTTTAANPAPLNGSYAMTLHREVGYFGNAEVDPAWILTTTCAAGATSCTGQVRRSLGSGGYKTTPLSAAAPGGPYVGTSAGTWPCAPGVMRGDQEQVTIHVNSTQAASGRTVVARFDGYLRTTYDCPALGHVTGLAQYVGKRSGS